MLTFTWLILNDRSVHLLRINHWLRLTVSWLSLRRLKHSWLSVHRLNLCWLSINRLRHSWLSLHRLKHSWLSLHRLRHSWLSEISLMNNWLAHRSLIWIVSHLNTSYLLSCCCGHWLCCSLLIRLRLLWILLHTIFYSKNLWNFNLFLNYYYKIKWKEII